MGIIKIILAFFLFYWLWGAVSKLFSAVSFSGSQSSSEGRRDNRKQSYGQTSYTNTSSHSDFDQKKRKMESDLSEEVDFEEIK